MEGMQAKNNRGEWVPAIPLALRRPFGLALTMGHPLNRMVCECGATFRSEEHYRGHYALVHVLGFSAR